MTWKPYEYGAMAFLAGICLAPITHAQEHKPSPIPLEVRVPFAPAAVRVGGVTRLFYEFHLASYAQGDQNLDELEIMNGDTGATLSDAKGPALDPLLRQPGVKGASADVRRIPAGSIAILYVETDLPAGAPAPRTLAWRLRSTKVGPADPAQPLNETPPLEGRVAIDPRNPVVIGFPLPPGRWVAAGGPSNTSDHRRSLLPVDGIARIAQRFAIDWVKLGPDGRLFHGDKAVNANWYGFGTDVLAVADATVSAAHDGVPENEPSDKRAVPITLETVGGNYLILYLGYGRYAFYAHLQPGSLRVHVGDKVRRGQVIALLGNTGNSDGPHLHFHVANANSPLGAEGVPYVFDAYRALGKATMDQVMSSDGWKAAPGAASTDSRYTLPAEDEVVQVP
ncbi:MAG: M23 family metallopeptidase [Caulobacteraceae bacterium]